MIDPNGYGNDSHCHLLVRGEESVSLVTFTEGSKVNGLTMTLSGNNPTDPTQNSTTFKLGRKSWRFDTGDKFTYSNYLSSEFNGWNFMGKDYCIDFYCYLNFKDRPDVTDITEIFSIILDSNNYHICYLNDTSIYYIIKESGTEIVNVSYDFTSIPENEWFHGAIVRKDSSFDIYINGEYKATDTCESILNSLEANFNIGHYKTSGNPSIYRYIYIDNFRVSIGNKRWDRNFIIPNRQY